jgi:hypothetical protein
MGEEKGWQEQLEMGEWVVQPSKKGMYMLLSFVVMPCSQYVYGVASPRA